MLFPISRSLSTSRRRTDELGSRLERPIHFECKLNEPMHIGMRLLHPAAADHSVSINRQQVQRIFSFSLRSRAVFIVLLHLPIWECLKTLVLADGESAVVVSFVEWIAHIRLHYPLLSCSDHLPCALQHAKRANTSLKECYGRNVFFKTRLFKDALPPVRFWMRSLPGAGWWSRSLPLVSGHWTRRGGFCGRVMPPLRGDDRRGAADQASFPAKGRGTRASAEI